MSLLLDALKRAAEAKRKQALKQSPETDSQVVYPALELTDAEPIEIDASITRAEAVALLTRHSRETQSISDDYLSVAADVVADDAGSHGHDDFSAAQVLANRVFTSKESLHKERLRRILLSLAGIVSLFSALVIGGYQYYSKMDSQLQAELQQVRRARLSTALNVERQAPVIEDTATTSVQAAPEVAFDEQQGSNNQTAVSGKPTSAVVASEASAPIEKKSAAKLSSAEPSKSPPVSKVTPRTPVKIDISSSNHRQELTATLNAAYQKFQNGDLTAAEHQYQQALVLDPDNRDAWLGKAAIFNRRQEHSAAVAIYQNLLRRNPADTAALAGVIELSQQLDSRHRESELKFALTRYPQAAELHFALGSLYSEEQRWPEAQAAFFQANEYAPDNPDYAFNLAVSLEYLGKPASALNYYRAALEKANTHAAGFDPRMVEERLRILMNAKDVN